MKKKRKIAAAMLAALVFAGSFNLAQTEIAEAVDDPSQHYDVWHDFEDQIWAPTPAGEQISGTYNTSMMLTHETETNSNKYMKSAGNHTSAWRATMYSLSDEEVSGAEVTFDFMPIRTNGSTRYGEMMFFSSTDHFSYFNIAFNEALQIYYYSTPGVNYTADLYAAIDMDGNPLPNGTYDTRNAALIDTGLQGDGSTWFEAKVVFDYVNSRADLTITNKVDPTKSFTQNGIPIREAAVNVNRFLLTAFKGQPEYGIDNFGVKYLTEIDPSRYYTTYWNDFETGVWEPKAIGTGIIAEGGTSGATLTQTAENADNRFMQVDAPNSGSYRVSRLDLPSDPLSGAHVTFDWKPISAQDSASRFGDVAFISSGSTHPYFGLQFNKNREISYYTIGENVAAGWGHTYSEEALEGGFKRDSAFDSGTAVKTGITADGNSWYRVNLSFDYDGHQADLTIASRDNPDNVLYQMENIPIYASAVNPAIVAAGGWKGIISMGLDNLGVRYQYSDADSISSLQQPASGMVTAAEWAEHTSARLAQVTATMGDGSIRAFEIGPWTSTPAFDESVFTTYTWTAPLVLPDGIRNPKNLALTYVTEYVNGYAATGAYDPTALELEFGSVSSVDELLGLLPTQTDAVLSNGKVVKMDIDADTWTATYTTLQDQQYLGSYVPPQFDSPEFDPEQEGVYVYKAKLKSTGEFEVNGDIWVEARVNYFAYDDNLNGYERAIENLDRGLYVIPNAVYDSATKTYIESEQGGNYLSWRILVDEYAKVSDGKNITFEIYRDGSKVATLENKTNYLDLGGEAGEKYQIKATQEGAASHSQEVEAMENNYLSLNLQRPLPSYSATGNFAMYRLNDLSVADVDGDGEYEIAVKWYPGNGFDPGISGMNRMSSPHIIDVYKMDGTALWRLNMGYSSPAGQHFDNFMFYDLDQDGEAELSILTQDGTRTYRPDENGQFRYVTTDENGHVFQPTNPADSESGGEYVLSDDGHGYVLSNAEGYDFAYVGDYGSPVMDDEYLVDVVGDIELEGANMRADGFKDIAVNEDFTVFNGKTGEIIDSVDYVFDSANVVGTDGFNLGNRYNIGIARIPADLDNPDSGETIPAVLANRAYYARATVAAYTLVDGEIQLAWTTDTINEIKGGGNHNMVTGDMDNDGFDELYLGGTAIDHDGSILWAKDGAYNKDFMKHGDMIAMTAVFPDSDQLYVFTPVEDKSVSTVLNYALTNAATGARIVGHTFGQADTGRGMVANVTPSAGYELWASTPSGMVNGRISGALFNAYGEVVARDGEALTRPAVQTWSGYWDGDLLAELPDSNPSGGGDKSGLPMGVHKYNWNTGETETIASFAGTLTNNSTKNNPGLMADIMGDWREEILVRSADNEELRIYMTGIPTEYAIYTLMHDSVYRNAVANQNTTYNQAAHTSFYLGEDEVGRNRVLNFALPTYPTRYTAELDDHEPVNPDTPTPPQPPVGGGTAQPDPKPELGKDGVIRLEGGPSEGSDPSLNAEIDGELAVDALVASPDGKLRIRSGGTGLTLEGKWLGELLKLDGRLGVQLGTDKPADLPEALRLAAERAGAEQVYSIAVEADGQTIDEIQRGSATVSLPYDSSEVAAPHRLVVYEMLEDGSLRPVALSRYDAENITVLFQPDRLSSRYLVMESQATFGDAGGWSLDAIEALAGRGIVNGKEEDVFDPRGMVTRAEFAAMLTRMFGLQADGGAAPFTDVPEDAWYGGDVAAAYALGIVKGRADGTFGGDESITREEMNVLLHRAATLLGLLQSSDGMGGSGNGFTDESDIAGYAIDAVRELAEAGLVTGHPDGTFAPKDTASREQSAAMLWRLLQQING